MSRPWHVLAVCTGNICRSPMAEALLRHSLVGAGLPALVASAGVIAVEQPADRHAVRAMAERGLDITDHLAHRLTPDDVAAADLVLTMERAHIVQIVGEVPDAFGRTFTLPELVRLGRTVGPRPAEVSLQAWLAAAGEGRTRTDILLGPADDDVPDPIGRPRRVFVRSADEIAAMVDELVVLLGGRAGA